MSAGAAILGKFDEVGAKMAHVNGSRCGLLTGNSAGLMAGGAMCALSSMAASG